MMILKLVFIGNKISDTSTVYLRSISNYTTKYTSFKEFLYFGIGMLRSNLYSTKLSPNSIAVDPVQLGGDSGVDTRLRRTTTCSTTDHTNGIHLIVRGVCVVHTATRVTLKWEERQEMRLCPQYLCLPPVLPGKSPFLEQKCKSYCHPH